MPHENGGLRIEETAQGITFQILVVPRASREAVGPVVGDRLKVAITAPPVEGKANAAVLALLARTLGVRRQQLEIVAGAKGKRKTVRVSGATRQLMLDALDREQR
jgi:uncharacterized protein (TIGR00251 family)